MKHLLPSILFFMSALVFNCQNQHDTLRIFFDIGKDQPAKGMQALDTYLEKARTDALKIRIYGYADYLSGEDYNLALSKRRAENIQQYLIKSFPALKNLVADVRAFGEQFSEARESREGEQFSRRVDLIFDYNKAAVNASEPPVKTSTKKPDRDTATEAKKVEDLEEGESLELEGLSFIPGRHMIMRNSVKVLETLLETMKEKSSLKIEIQGHVCCSDGEEDGYDYDTGDKKLSLNRAKAVYDYLVKNGIDKRRLQYRGFGHSKPKVDEITAEDEQLNRRVEIMVLEK